jgi:uncharacterized protein YdhG (YjbR/CyaY superfamily)
VPKARAQDSPPTLPLGEIVVSATVQMSVELQIAGGLMATGRPAPKSIDEYIAASSPEVRPILERIRSTIREAAPGAQEMISYRMPAFTRNGVLVYFAAFKNHIGLFPPVSGDARLEKAISRYAGEKGNLRFPLDRPIPYRLIERIVKLRVKQNLAKAAAKGNKGKA